MEQQQQPDLDHEFASSMPPLETPSEELSVLGKRKSFDGLTTQEPVQAIFREDVTIQLPGLMKTALRLLSRDLGRTQASEVLIYGRSRLSDPFAVYDGPQWMEPSKLIDHMQSLTKYASQKLQSCEDLLKELCAFISDYKTAFVDYCLPMVKKINQIIDTPHSPREDGTLLLERRHFGFGLRLDDNDSLILEKFGEAGEKATVLVRVPNPHWTPNSFLNEDLNSLEKHLAPYVELIKFCRHPTLAVLIDKEFCCSYPDENILFAPLRAKIMNFQSRLSSTLDVKWISPFTFNIVTSFATNESVKLGIYKCPSDLFKTTLIPLRANLDRTVKNFAKLGESTIGERLPTLSQWVQPKNQCDTHSQPADEDNAESDYEKARLDCVQCLNQINGIACVLTCGHTLCVKCSRVMRQVNYATYITCTECNNSHGVPVYVPAGDSKDLTQVAYEFGPVSATLKDIILGSDALPTLIVCPSLDHFKWISDFLETLAVQHQGQGYMESASNTVSGLSPSSSFLIKDSPVSCCAFNSFVGPTYDTPFSRVIFISQEEPYPTENAIKSFPPGKIQIMHLICPELEELQYKQ